MVMCDLLCPKCGKVSTVYVPDSYRAKILKLAEKGKYFNLPSKVVFTEREFINNFVNEIKAENAAIFVGAGLSIPAGIVDWRNLVRPLAEELKLDVNREHDLIAIAQYHCNQNGCN